MAKLKFVSEYKMPSYVAVRSEKEETKRQERSFFLKVLDLAVDMLTTMFVVGCATFGFVIAVFAVFMRVHAI